MRDIDSSISPAKHLRVLSFLVALLVSPSAVSAATVNFTQGTATAQKFGTHEIVLTGNGSVTNPFDTDATVTFTPPSGATQAKTVKAFYDGGNTWRARVYVTEAGTWQWMSSSATDAGLNGRSGSFTAVNSSLRGMIKKHPTNVKALITDNGQWFPPIIDWGAELFNQSKTNWQQFVQDDANMGVNMIIADASGDVIGADPTTVDPWLGVGSVDYTRYDLTQFQTVDARAIWIFNNYPEMYFEWVLLSVTSFWDGVGGARWMALPQSIRQNTMRYMIARWAAFPNLMWLNSLGDIDYWNSTSASYARDVGTFFAANDPWKHNFSVRGYRGMTFPFTSGSDLNWVGRISLQDSYGAGAAIIHQYDSAPLHVSLADQYQEGYGGPFANARYFYRWSYWSWILSGGSSCHGSYYATDPPYSTSGYTGLDSVPYVWKYFKDRNIDMGLFQPDPGLMSDYRPGASLYNAAEFMEVMRRGGNEFIVYHPNYSAADAGGPGSTPDTTVAAGMHLDLRSYPGTYQVEWYRPHDGLAQTGGTVSGGAVRDFTAPWVGYDAVMRLVLTGSSVPTAPGGLILSAVSSAQRMLAQSSTTCERNCSR